MAEKTNGNGFNSHRRRARKHLRQRRASGGKGGGQSFSIWIKLVIAMGAVAFTGLLVAAGAGLAVYRSYADDLVAPDELAINKPSFGAKVYDRNGLLLYGYVDDNAGLRQPVALSEVSPYLLAATIATEDDSFFSNPGVNIRGLGRAAWENFSPFSSTPGVFTGSGGSSITQQLVKNVYIEQEERLKRSIDRKMKETVFAIELTQRYDKERILGWYINQISYGGVYNGIQSASQGYFGKSAKDLTLAEAALLAGIPQSPAAYDPTTQLEAAIDRRNNVLDLMERQGRIQIGDDTYFTVTHEEIEAAKQEQPVIVEERFPILAPNFVLQYVQPQLEEMFGHEALYRDGLQVETTLDLNLQNQAQEIMEGWIQQFENTSNSHNGSVMVIDPKLGEVLVMVGSRDYFDDDIEGKNNNATACNSPGSAFKPFAYLTTFISLGWGPATMILDTPVSFPQIDGSVFSPANPSKNFSGPVTIRYALGNSLNVPPVKAAATVGADNIVAQARKMGFMNSFRLQSQGGCSNGGGYGPAIATGGVGVTLEEMMLGYSVLASQGLMIGRDPINPASRRSNERQIDPVSILRVKDARGEVIYDVNQHRKQARVVPAEYTYQIYSILSDASAQCATFGCGGISVPGTGAGVKTGTSEPFAANGPNAGKIGETWAFAYTPEYVVGIWAGNADNDPVVNIFSTSISFRTVRDTLIAAYGGRGATSFARPANVVDGSICIPSGMKPTSLCGKTASDIFARDKLPTQEDTWWQNVRIDSRNGKLAPPSIPPQFVQTQVMLVPPADLMDTDEEKKAMKEWADNLGIPLAPTELSDGQGGGGIPGGMTSDDTQVIILSPAAGASLTGLVAVTGRASSANFQSYKVEFGSGASPSNWTLLTQSNNAVPVGPLASWNTNGLAPGVYTVRLTVRDRNRGDLISSVTVTIGSGGNATPVPTPARQP